MRMKKGRPKTPLIVLCVLLLSLLAGANGSGDSAWTADSGPSGAMAVRSDVSVSDLGLEAAIGARTSMVVPPESSERTSSVPRPALVVSR